MTPINTTLPDIIPSAVPFTELMTDIWESDSYGIYADWSNARDVAEAYGAFRAYGYIVDGTNGYRYVFPDDTWLFISTDGRMTSLPRNRVKRAA